MKSGFFVSCKKGKEIKAFKELQTVLNASFDEIEIQKDYATVDITKELQNEITILQKSFFSIFFSYKSFFFVSNTSPIYPSKLFLLLKTKKIQLEYVHRIIPLDRFTTFNPNVILSQLSNINRSLSFKIEYEERFAPKVIKIKIFEIVTSHLKDMKVNLSDPDYLIVFSVLKNDIGMTVFKNLEHHFNFSKNYN